MKIDGGNIPGDDLLQRMQEASEQKRADSTETSTSGTAADFHVRQTESSEVGSTSEADAEGLELKLRETATAALEGHYDDPSDVRGAVIDSIVEERVGETIGAAERRRMSDTLKDALVDDPEFRRQVDDMLILAARDVGRSS